MNPLPVDHPALSLDAYRVVARGEQAVAEQLSRPQCPACGGSGYATREVDGILTTGRCRCQMLPDRIQLFNQAKIPARYAHATFVSFAQSETGTEAGTEAEAPGAALAPSDTVVWRDGSAGK